MHDDVDRHRSRHRRELPRYPRVDPPIDERASTNELIVGALVAAALGFVLFGLDLLRVGFLDHATPPARDCFWATTNYGGDVESIPAMEVMGIALWMTASVVAWCLRRNLTLVFSGFVVLYAAGLVVLWAVAPSIWGPLHCIA